MTESMMEKLARAVFGASYHPDDARIVDRIWADNDFPDGKQRAYRAARAVLKEVSSYIREQELAGNPACDVIDSIDHFLNQSGNKPT
jgi:hypothetical protein